MTLPIAQYNDPLHIVGGRLSAMGYRISATQRASSRRD